ncbi:MAG: fumarate reductase/succinate dehydrogenase flavoprotein domain protein [Clostridia bacterium]|jgi:fumarate reductase flavoprotein subunit|nr:fumarate reductase/succinate dehydrogenase flavoprotein domain protein [Clostridia bacterium]
MVFSLAACSQSTTGEQKAIYKAGTYTATAKGNNGDVTVEVKFDDRSIVSVKVLSHGETAGLSDTPIQRIPEAVVKGQTLAVDTVAGASNTSKAIIAAIEDCVKQAGGDVEALKANTDTNDIAKTETELTTDVVVIGAGGAGLSATDTKFQRELGIKDSKDSWMKLWKERQASSNPNSIYPDYNHVDKYMDEAVVTTEWLVDYIGHEYGSVTGYGMDPVERIHFPKMDASGKGGTVLIQNIEKFAKSKNIQIMLETPAKELLTDSNGNVVGVVAESKEGKDAMSKQKDFLVPVAKAPYYAIKIYPKTMGTFAGMKTDENYQVFRADGSL